MSNLFDDFNDGAPAPAEPPKAAPKPEQPATDFFSAETKARAQEAAKVAREKTQATVEVVAQRASDTLAQGKERLAKLTLPKVSMPKIPAKALGAVIAVVVVAAGAGWWFTRAPAPHPAPVAVAPSTPAPAPVAVTPSTPTPAPAVSAPTTQVVIAPPPVAPVPAPVAPVTPISKVTPTPVAASSTEAERSLHPTPGPIKSPTPEEIRARWAQNVHLAKSAPKPAVKPQYEQDADAALNAWKKSH